MRIPRDPFDRRVQSREIVDALKATENTAVYFDTSSLVWLYRLAVGARTEFIEWASTGPRASKVHAPVWALHELHKHRGSPDVLFPASAKAKAVKSGLRFLRDSAALYVDDAVASANNFDDREDYIKKFEDAEQEMIKALSPFSALKGVQQKKIEDQLLPFFEMIALKSSLHVDAMLDAEFSVRSEGRVPPGYKDSGKRGDDGKVGGSGANRFGDLVFWKEILAHAKGESAIEKVIIITHDRKPDWVYLPSKFTDFDGSERSNSDKIVTCPHPTLCHEAEVVAGINELHIITIPQLVELLSSNGFAREVTQLAQAVQIEQAAEEIRTTTEENGAEEEDQPLEVGLPETQRDDLAEQEPSAEVGGEVEENLTPVPLVAPEPEVAVAEAEKEIIDALNNLSAQAIADGSYEASGADDSPDAIIRALKSYNWYRQNPAIPKISREFFEGAASNDQLFLLGRNVYQAACGNANAAIRLIRSLPKFLLFKDTPKAELFFAGVLFEVYFGPDGEVRAKPKADFVSVVFKVSAEERYSGVLKWFRQKIAGREGKFIKLPGDPNNSVTFTPILDGEVGVGVSYNGMELTRTYNEDEDWALHWGALSKDCSSLDLKREIAEHFAIQESHVEIAPDFEGDRDFSSLIFVDWGPGTEVDFPQA